MENKVCVCLRRRTGMYKCRVPSGREEEEEEREKGGGRCALAPCVCGLQANVLFTEQGEPLSPLSLSHFARSLLALCSLLLDTIPYRSSIISAPRQSRTEYYSRFTKKWSWHRRRRLRCPPVPFLVAGACFPSFRPCSLRFRCACPSCSSFSSSVSSVLRPRSARGGPGPGPFRSCGSNATRGLGRRHPSIASPQSQPTKC